MCRCGCVYSSTTNCIATSSSPPVPPTRQLMQKKHFTLDSNGAWPMNPEERAAWLAARKKGVGASEVSAVLGLSPWMTPYQLYLHKRGEIPDAEENEAMRWGTRLEGAIAEEYAERRSMDLQENVTLISPGLMHDLVNPVIFATPDRIDEKRGINVQIKTSSHDDGWGEPWTDEVPDYVMVQVQQEMHVTGCTTTHIPLLIGGRDFRIYEVARHDALIGRIVAAILLFWKQVEDGTPPPVVTLSDARLKWPLGKQGNVQADERVKAAVDKLRELTYQGKLVEQMTE